MLYIPMLLGFLVGRTCSWNILTLFLAATGCFLGRSPLLAWARAVRWQKPIGDARQLSLIYLGVGGAAGLYLLVAREMWFLAPMAGIAAIVLGLNTWQGMLREDRTILGEVTAILGMTMTAPAALYATTDRFDSLLAILWLESILYFASSVFYVKMRVLAVHEKVPGSAAPARTTCLQYHVLLLITVALLAVLRLVPPPVALGFLPVIGRAFWFATRPRKILNLKQIGWAEVAFSVIFLATVGGFTH